MSWRFKDPQAGFEGVGAERGRSNMHPTGLPCRYSNGNRDQFGR